MIFFKIFLRLKVADAENYLLLWIFFSPTVLTVCALSKDIWFDYTLVVVNHCIGNVYQGIWHHSLFVFEAKYRYQKYDFPNLSNSETMADKTKFLLPATPLIKN